MTTLPVSVVMPVFNAAPYLEKSIESILNQSLRYFEFIILNDGSTDNSEEIILSFSDPRIRYYKNLENLGLIQTLNRGIELSEGNYIARMDADDIAASTRLAKQLEFMSSNPEVVVCGSQAEMIDSDGKVFGTMKCPVIQDVIKSSHLFNNAFIHPTTFFKADILKIFKYSEGYEHAEDYYLLAKLISRYEVANLEDILLSYRVHSTNVTSIYHRQMAKSRKKVHAYQLKNLLNAEPGENSIELLESFSISNFEQFELENYESFLQMMRDSNQTSGIYNQAVFERQLAEWRFRVLMSKAGRGILRRYFNSKMFNWSLLTMRHARKMLKQTIRGY